MNKRYNVLVLSVLLSATPAFAGEGSQRVIAQKIEQPAAFKADQTIARQQAAEKTIEQKNTAAALTVIAPQIAVLEEKPLQQPGEEQRLPPSSWMPPMFTYDFFALPPGGKAALLFVSDNGVYYDEIVVSKRDANGNWLTGGSYLYNKDNKTIRLIASGGANQLLQPGTDAWRTAYTDMIFTLREAMAMTSDPGSKSKLIFTTALIQQGVTQTSTNFSVFSRLPFPYGNPYYSSFEVNRVDHVIRAMEHGTAQVSGAKSYSINLLTKAISYTTQSGATVTTTFQFGAAGWAQAKTDMIATLEKARNAVFGTNTTYDRRKLTELIDIINAL